ncbi:MAG TPA: threonine-phosphate decarboxylase [Ruminococcus sp.]|nr:threonine-phosphate decarboxylase [Ruminococcus sp.]
MIQPHGGNIHDYPNTLDFSANINPLGMPDSVHEAIVSSVSQCNHYPDPYCKQIRSKMSALLHFPEDQIVFGNGAADLIYRIVHALRPKHALICAPGFSEYSHALQEVHCEIHEHFLSSESDFILDRSIFNDFTNEIEMIVLCSPNNPTGQLISQSLLRDISEYCRLHYITLLLDESFLSFVISGSSNSLLPYIHEHCIILNSFTKMYAIPGIRIGYALCGSNYIASKLQQTGQYWAVSIPAQAAAYAALDETDYAVKTALYIASEREFMTKELSNHGIRVFPSSANYLLIYYESDFAEAMLKQSILIRDCQNYHGLSNQYYRIAIRLHDDNLALISAIKRYQNG